VNGFDLLAVGEAQQPFAGPVYRGEALRHRRSAQFVMLGEAVAERLRQRGHLGEIGGAAMVDPVPQLARAKRFGAKGRHLGRQGVAAEPDQMAARADGGGFDRHYREIWKRAGHDAMTRANA
jgi:hypothetical protein